MLRLLLLLPLLVPCFGAPPPCPAGAPVASLRVMVARPNAGAPRPLAAMNRLLPGDRLRYHPDTKSEELKKAQVAIVLVPVDHQQLIVLEPKPARQPAEWTVPSAVSIASLVWGPNGLDKGKVQQFVTKDRELVAQLADYAQKTAQTETLLQALTERNQNYDNTQAVNAAILGFAAQSGGSKLDRTAPLDQQTMALLRTLNPALSGYDPLATESKMRLQQSAGLAASVAGLFFGSTVGLAASGAALFVNLRTLAFPNLEFRSSFAPPNANSQTVSLCAKREPPQARTKLAYLWAIRVPDAAPPTLAFDRELHAPIGGKGTAPVTSQSGDWALIERAQDWQLVSADGKQVPAVVKTRRETKTLELDLTHASIPAGLYTLRAAWDWDALPVKGNVRIYPFSNLDGVRLTPQAQDQFIAGSGKVLLQVEGADFQFLDKLSFRNPRDAFGSPVTLPFRSVGVSETGTQPVIETEIDTRNLSPGQYSLLLTQQNGQTREVPVKLLPVLPQVTSLPLRIPLAEAESITLKGSGLSRVKRILCDQAEVTLQPASADDSRAAQIQLADTVPPGAKLPCRLDVEDVSKPVLIAQALEAALPRPRIQNVQAALPENLPVELRPGELIAGSFASFSLQVQHAGSAPAVNLSCRDTAQTLKQVSVRSGEAGSAARLRIASPETLFLSFDPGQVGAAGCAIQAVVENADGVRSAPKALGKVVRLPRLESFQLTDEKVGDSAYAGILKGQDLETIEKVGWDAEHGVAVEGLPVPIAGEGQRQSLKLALPWPSPAPHAPLFLWLRGEQEGRATTIRY